MVVTVVPGAVETWVRVTSTVDVKKSVIVEPGADEIFVTVEVWFSYFVADTVTVDTTVEASQLELDPHPPDCPWPHEPSFCPHPSPWLSLQPSLPQPGAASRLVLRRAHGEATAELANRPATRNWSFAMAASVIAKDDAAMMRCFDGQRQ